MRDMFEKLAKYALLRGILYVALGVLMVASPAAVMRLIVYILAGYAIVMGAINIVAWLRERQDGPAGFSLVSGILFIVMGIVMVIFTRGLLSILPIFLGVLLLIGGVTRLVEAIGAGPALGGARVFLILLAVLIIIGGFAVIANPFGTSVLLFRVFGILVVAQGVGELISYFSFKKIGKD